MPKFRSDNDGLNEHIQRSIEPSGTLTEAKIIVEAIKESISIAIGTQEFLEVAKQLHAIKSNQRDFTLTQAIRRIDKYPEAIKILEAMREENV